MSIPKKIILLATQGAVHTGGGGLVYGDGSWDLTVFVTDLQVRVRDSAETETETETETENNINRQTDRQCQRMKQRQKERRKIVILFLRRYIQR